jgi:hypothetical protein
VRKGPGTPTERFWRRVQVTDGCWTWIGRIDRKGYGRTDLMGERNRLAHYLSYRLLVGDELQSGTEFDHTCHTQALRLGLCLGGNDCLHRRCVNPAHLERVTHHANVLRGNSLSATRARQTHCLRGHLLGGDNVSIDRYGRHCRACRKAKMAEWWIRRKQERSA